MVFVATCNIYVCVFFFSLFGCRRKNTQNHNTHTIKSKMKTEHENTSMCRWVIGLCFVSEFRFWFLSVVLDAIFDQVVIFYGSVLFLLSHRMCPDLWYFFFSSSIIVYECAFFFFCFVCAPRNWAQFLPEIIWVRFWFELKPIHVINSIVFNMLFRSNQVSDWFCWSCQFYCFILGGIQPCLPFIKTNVLNCISIRLFTMYSVVVSLIWMEYAWTCGLFSIFSIFNKLTEL